MFATLAIVSAFTLTVLLCCLFAAMERRAENYTRKQWVGEYVVIGNYWRAIVCGSTCHTETVRGPDAFRLAVLACEKI